MLSRWIYILIGNDRTGKTTFQKKLIYHLCRYQYQRLDRNLIFDINHGYAPKKFKKLFIMSRSYHENKDEYKSIERYFNDFFTEGDICILSMHAQRHYLEDIKQSIKEGKKRYYNIGGVFFTNATSEITKEIALLDWDERFLLDNPTTDNPEKQIEQINGLAWEFAEMVIRRACQQ